jgi:hypothetical protein
MFMLRHRGVALAMLLVLAALPVNATICVIVCTPAGVALPSAHTQAGHHHGAQSSGPVQVAVTSSRVSADGVDCVEHTLPLSHATEARSAFEVDARVLMASGVFPVHGAAVLAPASASLDMSSGPPFSPGPPAHAPLVLRV